MILRERPVSRYSREVVGFALYIDGQLSDPDPDEPVRVDIERLSDNQVLHTGAIADRDDEGLYSVSLPSAATAEIGDYKLTWRYFVDEEELVFVDEYRVFETMPFWDSLDLDEKSIVMNVYHKVSHLFDSVEGGPYLWELLQSNFNAYETIARLMCTDAVTYINFAHQPVFDPPFLIGVKEGKIFPKNWYGLLDRAAYVEFLKHLSRSYIEQPTQSGVNVAYLDRKEYRRLWREEHQAEKAELDQMLKQFKRRFLVRTRRSWILAGGTVGRYFPNAARPTWLYRH